MSDLISRHAAIDTLNVGAELLGRLLDNADLFGDERAKYKWGLGLIESYISDVKKLPSAQQMWIPFKRRKPTEEEVTAFDYIMDCKCPEDGQNILVSINIQGHEPVQYDTFYGGGGEECCLESGYELVKEATAWMPLPEPYKEGNDGYAEIHNV